MSPTPKEIELEDSYLDIIKKASIGKGLGKKELAKLCREDMAEINVFFAGKRNDKMMEGISALLELDFKALQSHANLQVHPDPISLKGLAHFQSKFPISNEQYMWVNHFIIHDPTTKDAILFDTGTQSNESIEWLNAHDLSLKAIFITHQHKDHIYCLNDFTERAPSAPIYNMGHEHLDGNFQELELDKLYTWGALSLKAFETPGHTPDGISYLIKGLNKPITIVGDALFAHSQGGIASPDNYASALKINYTKLLSLDPKTIIAPGHGPLTSVGHEQHYNPFYAHKF